MNLLDQKYIYLLSSRLPKFTVKHKTPLTVNFRCVVCGDSKKNKSKSRGYIIEKKGGYFYYCHNCHVSHKFQTFLKRFDFNLYQQYMKEKVAAKFDPKIKEMNDQFKTAINKTDFTTSDYKEDRRFTVLKSLNRCTGDAPEFLENRNIPKEKWKDLFYCPHFKIWTNLWVPKKFDHPEQGQDLKAIIIPIVNDKKKLIGYQGRILGHKDIRYITISLSDHNALIYNLENIDLKKRVYVFEGPFDSMFIPNSVAVCGGAIEKRLTWNKKNTVIVYDNESRSTEAIKNITNALNAGYKVCIWPENESLKDVNDMVNSYVKNGMPLKQAMITVKQTIDNNVFEGLQGLLQLNKWKKR